MKRIACIHWTSAAVASPPEPCELQVVERCGQFSPVVGFDPTDPHSVFVDVTGLAHLFGGETAMAEALLRDLTQLGFTVRAALADTLGAAWAAVHYCEMPATPLVPTLRVGTPVLRRSASPTSTQSVATRGFPRGAWEPEPILNLQSSAFLHSLPIEALRLPAETVRVLHELGFTCIGQLEAIPREEFLSRFGPALLQRLDQAFGRLDEPLPACPLPPKFEAGWAAEYPTARRETIAAAIEWLIARVAALLARGGRGALRLDCRLLLEINNQQSTIDNLRLSIGLFQPTADAKRLFDLVQLQLERLRIASPVTAIRVTAPLAAPLEPRKQSTLFDLDGDPRQSRRLAMLVERLGSRLGSRAVVGVRLRPEAQPELSWHYDPLVGRPRRLQARTARSTGIPACARMSAAPKGHSSPSPGQRPGEVELTDSPFSAQRANRSAAAPPELPPRPLRLLPRPLPVFVTSIAPDGPPLRFQLDGCQHTIAQTWGPERIQTGWWRGRPIGRDYFRVETTTTAHFWLFRRLRDDKWFLHGMFD